MIDADNQGDAKMKDKIIKLTEQEKIAENEYNLEEMNVSQLTPLQILEKQFIQPLTKMTQNFHNFMAMIEKVIDWDKLENEREYMITPSYDGVLVKLDKQIKEIAAEMGKIRHQMNRELGGESGKKKGVTLAFKTAYGWHLKTPSARGFANISPNYIKLSILKSSILYTTPDLSNLSNERQAIVSKYNARQEAIVKKVIEVTTSYTSVISNAIQAFSQLDIFLSFAHVASCAPQVFFF
ncbi:DNA mismatch repair protein msh-2 [Reticulomyxa filosa]|uniref:DNA mismatch repair protein msh-2 n=1 Tax=Reticulomyxa filosa TaxID=46433 RepID=X6PCP5_RETFI|nr:DNA mismatch repair protein msh-2 [Reticulomyxa filosa]|eukprot:ETO35422.1 DNA mismatch repair protein msh-2 [Reticulomyxa filosa]